MDRAEAISVLNNFKVVGMRSGKIQLVQAIYMAIAALREQAVQPSKEGDSERDQSQWISVKERLPEPEQVVLVQCETNPNRYKYQCLAFYVPKKWLREASDFNWDYECCDEYDEEADDYYVNEGWYERIYNWDDYSSVGIGDFITHWMPIPEPPDAAVQSSEESPDGQL